MMNEVVTLLLLMTINNTIINSHIPQYLVIIILKAFINYSRK